MYTSDEVKKMICEGNIIPEGAKPGLRDSLSRPSIPQGNVNRALEADTVITEGEQQEP